MFLLLLFGIEIEKGEEKDSTWLLFMFHKTLSMLYLICIDVDLLSNNRGQLRNIEYKLQEWKQKGRDRKMWFKGIEELK